MNFVILVPLAWLPLLFIVMVFVEVLGDYLFTMIAWFVLALAADVILFILLMPGASSLEFAICLLLIPMLFLFQSRVRSRPGALYACALLVVLGFIANRLNVTVTGLEASSGAHYVPKWSELSVTLSMVALGFAVFRYFAQHFPIFEERRHPPAHEPEGATTWS